MAATTLSFYPYRTPHGLLTIAASKNAVTGIEIGNVQFPGTRRPSDVTNAAANELMEYFAGRRTTFDVPLAPAGSTFQHAVWDIVRATPYGTTTTCAHIAEQLGRPDSFRTVGLALAKSPILFMIPTHRIVGANGKPAGATRYEQLFEGLVKLEQTRASRVGR